MLVSKNAKICITPNANTDICITPNASRWNIGGVWSPMRGAGVGHVHFMFFVLISFVLGSQREPSFQWNVGFTVTLVKLSWTFHCYHNCIVCYITVL